MLELGFISKVADLYKGTLFLLGMLGWDASDLVVTVNKSRDVVGLAACHGSEAGGLKCYRRREDDGPLSAALSSASSCGASEKMLRVIKDSPTGERGHT